MKLSPKNRILKVYRWFKRRQLALNSSRKGRRELEDSQTTGARVNICPIIRMTFLWGPFGILPMWFGVFVLFRAALVTVVYALLGALGILLFTKFGWIHELKTVYEWMLWSMPGAVAGVAVCLGVLLVIGAYCWIRDRIGEFFKKPEQSEAKGEVNAGPVVDSFWKGVHDKFCPLATIAE